jgi:hypothetical protein
MRGVKTMRTVISILLLLPFLCGVMPAGQSANMLLPEASVTTRHSTDTASLIPARDLYFHLA